MNRNITIFTINIDQYFKYKDMSLSFHYFKQIKNIGIFLNCVNLSLSIIVLIKKAKKRKIKRTKKTQIWQNISKREKKKKVQNKALKH